MSKMLIVTGTKSFWICPNYKCEMIYLGPPVKCAKCGYNNKNRLENMIFDNLIPEKRDSKTNQELKSDLGFARWLFTKNIKQQERIILI